MLNLGSTKHTIKHPTDRIRDGWINEFNENKDFIAHKIAKHIVTYIFPHFQGEYYNRYRESPTKAYPLSYVQEITPQTVYKILNEKGVSSKQMAPLKEWRKALAHSKEVDEEFFEKKMGALTQRIVEIVPAKLQTQLAEAGYSHVRHKSILEWNSVAYTVHTKLWLKHKKVVPQASVREESKWTKSFNKHFVTVASKLADHLLDQMHADIHTRNENPAALHPKYVKHISYNLHFSDVLLLIRENLDPSDVVSPFNHWIECLDTQFPNRTDFHYFKDKIARLFQEVDVYVKEQVKTLSREGIILKRSLVDNSHQFTYNLFYHTTSVLK